jgi:cell division protein FtsB
MNALISNRFFLKQNIMMLLGACLCLYFMYHSIHGSRSYPRLLALQNQVHGDEQKLSELQQQRQELESRVVMLRPSTLNKDFAEERAREVLGYKKANEMIILKGE